MRQAPQRVRAEQLTGEYPAVIAPDAGQTTVQIDGNYVKARGVGFFSLSNRFKLALDVFKGKADALYWYKQ